MEVIATGRRMGKTTHMMNILIKNPDMMLVTHAEEEAIRLRHDFPDLASRIISVEDRHKLRGKYARVLIDNADMVLQSLFPLWLIHTVAMTSEPHYSPELFTPDPDQTND